MSYFRFDRSEPAQRPPLSPSPLDTSRPNILIAGSTGQVGGELLRCLESAAIQGSRWNVRGFDRATLDLTQPDALRRVVQSVRPDIIINATGYTAVDQAESEPDLARKVNADGVAALAHAAKEIGATVIHYSTDYVFDGRKRTPYQPDDAPNPQSAYARTKLAGEQALMASGAKFIILRTQWVYGLHGRNFVLAVLQQAMKRPELRIVNDQVGAPTWAKSIARATRDIIQAGLDGREGIYHLACGGSTTWFDFANAVFEIAACRVPGFVPPKVTPVSTAEYGAKAARPAFAVLDCSKTESVFGVRMPEWREALDEAMQDDAALRAIIASNTATAR